MNENESLRAELALARDTVARLEGDLAILEAVNSANVNALADAVVQCDDLLAECERWMEKAQEAGAAYANANTKHHAELDRANRLERLADTLAGKAVDLEDTVARLLAECVDRESERGDLRDRVQKAEGAVARVEALHVPCSEHPTCTDIDNFCHECQQDSPCTTRRFLKDPS